MKYLIYGAGTIGITYAWLLSRTNDVHLLVRPERLEEFSKGVTLAVKDLRKKSADYEKMLFYPNCVAEVSDHYDGILTAVNRCQLRAVLPELAAAGHLTKFYAFMQNNWNIRAEITAYIPEDRFIIAFPSSVGGGRDSRGIEVCRSQGVRTDKAFPADFFKLPLPIVAHIMQKMFLSPNTVEMVNNHMKKGLPEWIAGYYEILQDGLEAGLPMAVWKSYDTERLRAAAEGQQSALLFV